MVKTLNPRIRAADVMPDVIGAAQIAAGGVGTSELATDAVTVAKMNEYHHTDVIASGGTTCSHGLGAEPTIVHTSIKSGDVITSVAHLATASTLILTAEASGPVVEWQVLA